MYIACFIRRFLRWKAQRARRPDDSNNNNVGVPAEDDGDAPEGQLCVVCVDTQNVSNKLLKSLNLIYRI